MGGVWGRMDTCVRMAESLCCSPETVTTLLIGYTPIQNKVKKKQNKTNRNRVFADVSWGSRWDQTGLQWALNSMPSVLIRRREDTKTWWRGKQTRVLLPQPRPAKTTGGQKGKGSPRASGGSVGLPWDLDFRLLAPRTERI